MKNSRLLVSFSILSLSCSPLFAADAAVDLMHQLDNAYVQVFEKVAPAVVIIEAQKKKAPDGGEDVDGLDFFFQGPNGPNGGHDSDDSKPRFHLPQQPAHSEGSGFVVRPNGYILTNNHVIDGADKIGVKLKDGRHFTAKVAGVDDKTDIAVLKIEADGLPVAPLADSDAVRVGQQCFAIGIPYDQDYSFSAGHVSGKGRNDLASSETRPVYEDYIQTDAFINPGNSGGPLFDIDGRVIGMNTLINGMSRNLAFAIPSNMLREIGDQLIAGGKVSRPWLGLRIGNLGENSPLAEHLKGIEKGAVVVAIEPDTPAYNSDLRPADVITAVDGAQLSTAHDLQKEILKKKIGQSVELSVWRDGKSLKIPITTGELPTTLAGNAMEKAPVKTAAPTADLYGLQLQNITPEIAEQFKLKASAGALVTDVAQGSPAAEADLHQGDLITEIDEKPVADADSARKLLENHDGKRPVLLFIEGKRGKTYTVIKPGK
jgi:Do/DeqQ family serine protease